MSIIDEIREREAQAEKMYKANPGLIEYAHENPAVALFLLLHLFEKNYHRALKNDLSMSEGLEALDALCCSEKLPDKYKVMLKTQIRLLKAFLNSSIDSIKDLQKMQDLIVDEIKSDNQNIEEKACNLAKDFHVAVEEVL